MRRLCSLEVPTQARRSGSLPQQKKVNCGAARLLRTKVGRLLLWCRRFSADGIAKVPVGMGVRLRVFNSQAPVVVTVLSAPVGSNSLLRAAVNLTNKCSASVNTMRLGVNAHTSLSPAGASLATVLMFGAMVHARLRSSKLSAAVRARLLLLGTRVKGRFSVAR